MKFGTKSYIVFLPVVYLFVTIFLLRGKVQFVYAAAAALVAVVAFMQRRYSYANESKVAHWMLVLSAIGLSAAVILSIEKVALLLEPSHQTSCSLSPVVSCSPIIMSPQASVFGFPNPFIGVFGFTAVFTAAMTLLAGATKLHKMWWRTLLAGIVFGVGFSIWLIHEGVFEIGKLCLYCMMVWLVTFALFWLVASHGIANKHFSFGKTANKYMAKPLNLILLSFAVVAIIIFLRWSDYWHSLV